MRVLEVDIKNWAKFNPRSDAKACSWFRMSNSFFTDADFYGASLEARMTWIFILSASSQKMSSTIKINTQMIADSLAVKVETIDFAIEELFKIGCIGAPNAEISLVQMLDSESEMLHEVTFRNEQTNVTNERNEQTNKHKPSDVIKILNTVCGTSYKTSSSSHVRHIQSRFNDGHSIEDFAAVIKFKNEAWSKDKRMSLYLRPETLFGPKFDSYLQESKRSVKTKNNPTGNPYYAELQDKFGKNIVEEA